MAMIRSIFGVRPFITTNVISCGVKTVCNDSTFHSAERFGLIGVCEDRNSSFLTGPANAPDCIRRALQCDSSNSWSELGVNTSSCFVDYGNVYPPSNAATDIESSVAPVMKSILDKKRVPFALGGDHSISYPLVKFITSQIGPVSILHLDAHPDLYENFEDNPSSHASPFARICESSLCKKLVSVGIRTLNGHQREQVNRFGIKLVEAHQCPMSDRAIAAMLADLFSPSDSVYISLDMDVLDPGFAPGVSHREPGGLSTRQVINLIHCVPGNIVGMDLVEYNPERDLDGMTGVVAAKLVKEMYGRVLSGPRV